MRAHSHLTLALLAAIVLALGCDDSPRLLIHLPEPDTDVTSCEVELMFLLAGSFVGEPEVQLNGAPLAVPLESGPPGVFRATLGPEDGLNPQNVLVISATRVSDGELEQEMVSFGYAPHARAYRIDDPDDLILGPLGHSRVGDYMIESCVARFAIQDEAQRDLYSVGQYGGNLIDAERIGRPGLDNFLELQPAVNVETVINAQDVFIVNDGSDGLPAVVRACGPDDLLDFVNPSSAAADAGLVIPAALNDNDQTIEGCTEYSVSALDSHVAVTTTLTNVGGSEVKLLAGDWLNQGGELDVAQSPNKGVGAAVVNLVGAMSFYGYGGAVGVDYSYTSTPPPDEPGSYVVISGVTVILHNARVLQALLGAVEGTAVAPGESFVMERHFGVGDGTASNAIDLEIAIKGLASATLEGCVTVGGVPAPGAKVTVGEFNATDTITNLVTHFVTGADGCYAGDVPVAVSPTVYGVAAARAGTLYEGSASQPVIHDVNFFAGAGAVLDIDLPPTGVLRVTTTNEADEPIPARVTIVGIDPSPSIQQRGPALPGFGSSQLALFEDPGDSRPFGVVRAIHTGADGVATFDLEPGFYRMYVSRGPEYSTFDRTVRSVANETREFTGQIARVIDTEGFVSSDFHVHGINSADSRVSHRDRVEGYAGEGVDNIVMTDHHVHTDLDPVIAELGLSDWISATVGEEITTFDYGHFNGYPFTVDPTRISGGSTDWAVAAPPGQEFPSQGAFNATPVELFVLATTGPSSTPDTTVQINHIDSHFEPLRIDTALVPPRDGLDAADRLERRLDEPVTTNLFFPFPALELWNGESRGAQRNFLEERIGIWFNLLNQGIETTFIADTDSHRFTNLGMSGARTWTAASPESDDAGTVDSGEVANMVDEGKATGGQGVFVTTRLRATDGSGLVADLSRYGTTHMTDAAGNVELDIRIQAPLWAPFDLVQVYANAATVPNDVAEPYLYGALPTMELREGDCDPTTTGDGDFDVTTVSVAPIAGGDRLEANITIPFDGLTENTWFVVVVSGSDGMCPAMFPVFAAGLDAETNTTLADFTDGNVGEGGVLSLGATNALYFDAP